MNARASKMIRKQVYGDFSHRDTQYKEDWKGTIKATGMRSRYQNLKKLYIEHWKKRNS